MQSTSSTYPCIPSTLISLPQLTQPRLLFLSQIRELLNLSLVEPVDNRVLTCDNMYALDLQKRASGNISSNNIKKKTNLLVVFKTDLSNSHTSIFLQVRPWCVNDRDVILLVACETSAPTLFAVNTHEKNLLTLDTVRLRQLRAINQQRLADLLPILALRHAEVDMCGREIVDVKPHVLLPAVFDEFLIYKMCQWVLV